MINTSVNKNEHTIQSGVVDYPIGFPFYFNPDRTPQLRVKIGDEELRFNHNFELSEDKGSVVLMPTEEESWTLEGPEDFSWMTKWDGKDLLIERAVPFVQDSDYQLGRISSEQIERDFDLSVMRDQILAEKIDEHTDDVQGEIDALHSRIDFVQEEHFLDMAAVDEVMATKATKTELENAKTVLGEGIQGNVDAILKTRNDYIEADSKIHKILNNHEGELTTLHNDIDDLGDQVSGIEEKIPESASGSNQLATREDLKSIDLDNYVKKSGDTMTGDLTFEDYSAAHPQKHVLHGDSSFSIKYYYNNEQYPRQSWNFAGASLFASTTTGVKPFLGHQSHPWGNVYTKKLNNGADITIPTLGGTLARLEDLIDLRADINEADSELQTQITAQAAEIATKQDQLIAGDNIVISGNTISATGTGGVGFDMQVVDQLPATGEKGVIYLVPKDGSAPDVHDEYVWIDATQTFELIGTTAVDLSGYLPLSGGTMTGSLGIEDKLSFGPWKLSTVDNNNNILAISCGAAGRWLSFDFNSGAIYPMTLNLSLGGSATKWTNVFTKKINNGADLIVPTEGGTLARLEDLEGIGGASLPDQTGNAGKFLMTDGKNASWGAALVNNAQDSYSFAVGPTSSSRGASATAVGRLARAWAAGATQLGNGTNVDANTFKVANTNGNFEMMDADGNVPLGRLTYVTNQIGDISTALTAILGE